MLILSDVEIHAASIGFISGFFFPRKVSVDAMRCVAKLEHALGLVMPQQGGTHDFGQCTIGAAAIRIHLPEAVLRGDVTLRNEHVLFSCGIDMGHAMLIAADGARSGE